MFKNYIKELEGNLSHLSKKHSQEILKEIQSYISESDSS